MKVSLAKNGQDSTHTHRTKLFENADGTGTRVLVQLGDDSVGWMRDDSTEDACNVARSEGDDQLLGLGALGSWLRNHVLIELKQKGCNQCNGSKGHEEKDSPTRRCARSRQTSSSCRESGASTAEATPYTDQPLPPS